MAEKIKNLKIGDTSLLECPFWAVGPNAGIFYDKEEGGGGFRFFAANMVAGLEEEAPHVLLEAETEAECLFHEWANFDGIRHMYMGSEETDNENYLNYPSTALMRKVFEALHGLELRYCSQPEVSDDPVYDTPQEFLPKRAIKPIKL